MSYLEPFVRLTFGGTLADDQEIWSCNLHIANTGETTHTPTEFFDLVSAVLPDLGSELETYVSSTNALVPSGVKLNYVKIALIGTDGLYMGAPYEIPLDAIGHASGGYLPQGALTNTMYSSKYKDPGKYNRFYLPIAAPTGAGEYKLSSGLQSAYAENLWGFVTALNDALIDAPDSFIGTVSVISNSSTGYSAPVVGVMVGQIIDTQRRRRNKLNEVYERFPA